MSSLRKFIRHLLPYNQVLGLVHRVRNHNTLTVVAFHRVLREGDPRWAEADPKWTVSEQVFESCAQFFCKHYNVIGLPQLQASVRDKVRLPPRSLLITFDDGYADNLEYAWPILKKYSLPGVVFVTTNFIGRNSRPWVDDLYWQWQQGNFSDQEVTSVAQQVLCEADRNTGSLINELRMRYPSLEDAFVDKLFMSCTGRLLPRLTTPTQMLSEENLLLLHRGGVAIGAHGLTHAALDYADDLPTELLEPKRRLAAALGMESADPIVSLAFPYGRYSEKVVQEARRAGYQLLFTFDFRIQRLSDRNLAGDVIDRLNVFAEEIAPDGHATPERLARYFFLCPLTEALLN